MKDPSIHTTTQTGCRFHLGAFFRPISGVVLLFFVFCLTQPVLAQDKTNTPTVPSKAGSEEVTVSNLTTDHFPVVSLHFEPFDEQGNFISSLQASSIHVIEDGQSIAPDTVAAIQNNLQITVALNLNADMGYSSSGKLNDGNSTYDHIRQVLTNWARSENNQDDFSLSTSTGLFLIRSKNSNEWAKALADYNPDWSKIQPGLNSLSEALNLATDPTKRLTTGHAILFITPTLSDLSAAALKDQIGRANQSNTKIFVWLFSRAQSPPASSAPLRELAAQTGGDFHEILATDPLPDFSGELAGLRNGYQVQYQSQIKKSGDHSLAIQITTSKGMQLSETRHFSLTILPPNPIFLSPPETVHRTWQTGNSIGNGLALSPNDVSIQIMVEFPDSFQRDLMDSKLYVDDSLMAENRQAPFDRFSWSLNRLDQSATHTLRVEVVDALGLTGTSTDLLTQVQVDSRDSAPATSSTENTSILQKIPAKISTRTLEVIGAVSLSGIALALVLMINERKNNATNKRQPRQPSFRMPAGLPAHPIRSKTKQDTRPIAIHTSRETEPASLPRKLTSETAPDRLLARLVSLDEREMSVPGGIIPITGAEMTFGSDPQRATRVIDSTTVNGLHARLYHDPENHFYLADQNSIAGTWINYAPVTERGARLEHGDLIHIGRCMFRFELVDPTQSRLREIKVVGPEKESQQKAGDHT